MNQDVVTILQGFQKSLQRFTNDPGAHVSLVVYTNHIQLTFTSQTHTISGQYNNSLMSQTYLDLLPSFLDHLWSDFVWAYNKPKNSTPQINVPHNS